MSEENVLQLADLRAADRRAGGPCANSDFDSGGYQKRWSWAIAGNSPKPILCSAATLAWKPAVSNVLQTSPCFGGWFCWLPFLASCGNMFTRHWLGPLAPDLEASNAFVLFHAAIVRIITWAMAKTPLQKFTPRLCTKLYELFSFGSVSAFGMLWESSWNKQLEDDKGSLRIYLTQWTA